MPAATIEKHSLIIPPKLAQLLGKNEAILLQQVHYWLHQSPHMIEGLPWIYNTYKAWAKQICFLSVSTIRRAFKSLREQELIVVDQHEKKQWKRRLWYTINYEKLADLNTLMCSLRSQQGVQSEQLDVFKLSTSSISETSSETNSLNTTNQGVESENGNVLKQEGRNEQERSCTNPPVETIPVTPGLLVDPQDPGGDKLVPATARNAEMLKTLAETGIEANPTIEKYLRRFRNAPDRISNAIAVVRQQAAKGAMRSAAAVFVDAIQHNRKPNPAVSATPVYPDGDWLTESGRLDQSFILNQAQLWRTGDQPKSVAFSKMQIEETMACVCSHYLNHPAKLAIDWQAYYAKSHRYLENVSLRLEAGATIQEKEQTGVLALLPLLTKAVSQPVYESLPAPMLPAHSPFRLLTAEVSDA